MIGLLALFAAAAGLGAALLRRSSLQDRPLVSRFVLSWGLGIAVFSGTLVAGAMAGLPIGRMAVIGLIVLGLALGAALGGRAGASSWPLVRLPLERIGLAAALVVASLIAVAAVTLPSVSVDGRTLWSYHARLIYDTGAYPAPELRDPRFAIPHPQYPPLLPMAEAAAAWANGAPEERVLRAVATAFYVALALLLVVELPRRDPRFGLLLALAWILMPTLVLFEEGGADSGVADTPLAFFILASLVAADAGAPVVAGGFLAAAGFTKNEGMVLGILLLAARSWRGPRAWRSVAVMTMVFAAAVVPWLVVRAGIPAGYDERYASRLFSAVLADRLPRAGPIALEMLRVAFFYPQRAGLFWWMVVALWAGSGRRLEILAGGRLWIVPAYAAIVFGLYLVSPWDGLVQVQFSFSRILLHLAPLALWAITEPAPAAAPTR